MYRKFFKRPMDITLSLLAIIVLSPVFVIIATLVRYKLGSPVIFKQRRPGLNEKIFTMYKFRTMTDQTDDEGNLLPDSIRLTRFGKLLRATSLDELPELLNILKGDMSIVGPRPLSIKYIPYYKENERLRHTIRPGLTGYAQVNGRNSLTWERKFELDVKYIQTVSLKQDLEIIYLTIKKVLLKSDIGQAEEAPISLHILRGSKTK